MPSHCSNKCPWLIKTHYSMVSACLSSSLSPHMLPLSLATLWSLEFIGSLNVQCFLWPLGHFASHFFSLKTPSSSSCLTLCLTTYSLALRCQFNFLFLPEVFPEHQVQVKCFSSLLPWCHLLTAMVPLTKFHCNCFFFMVSSLKARTIVCLSYSYIPRL